MWSDEVECVELEKGDRGLGFSILDYQVGFSFTCLLIIIIIIIIIIVYYVVCASPCDRTFRARCFVGN